MEKCIYKSTFFLFISSILITNLMAEEFVFYQLKKGEYISEVLNDLGVCPLYGRNGKLKQVLSSNPGINPDDIKTGEILKIPYHLLNHPDKVLFFTGNKVLPKTSESNLCALKKRISKKNKDNNEKLISKQKIKKEEEYTFRPEIIDPNVEPEIIEPSKDVSMNIENTSEAIESSEELPKILSIISPKNEDFLEKEELIFTVIFDQAIKVNGTPYLKIKTDKLIDIAKFSSIYKNSISFKYKNTKKKQIQISPSFLFSEGQITNLKDSVISEKFTLPSSNTIIVKTKYNNKNTLFPRVISIEHPNVSKLNYGDKLEIAINFSSPVYVKTPPLLRVKFDSGDVFAKYAEGSGTKTLIFDYFVHPGDYDDNGIEIVQEENDNQKEKIEDFEGRKAIFSFEKVTAHNISIDGSNLYRKVNNFNFFSKRFATLNKSAFSLSPSYRSYTLSGGSTIKSTSALDVSMGWQTPASGQWNLGIEGSIKNSQFENDLEAKNNYSLLAFSEFKPNGIWSIYQKVGIDKKIYFSNNQQNQELHSVTNFRVDLSSKVLFWKRGSLTLGSNLGLHYLFGKANQHLILNDGFGYNASLFALNHFKDFNIKLLIDSEYSQQKSNIAKHINKNVGFSLQYILPIGAAF